MATSYERVLEAARRYSRDPRLQELPRDTSGRQHAQCSCPAHDGDGGTSLHITYDQSNGKPCCTASERNTAMPLPLPVHLD